MYNVSRVSLQVRSFIIALQADIQKFKKVLLPLSLVSELLGMEVNPKKWQVKMKKRIDNLDKQDER